MSDVEREPIGAQPRVIAYTMHETCQSNVPKTYVMSRKYLAIRAR